MHKMKFGHAYCQDLVKRVLRKFNFYFPFSLEVYSYFLKFLKWKRKLKHEEQCMGQIWPTASHDQPSPMANT
jgi:hypothetical protein